MIATDNKYKPAYAFSTHIGAARAKQFRMFASLAEKLKIDVTDLMRQCNGKIPPSKALVKGLVKELARCVETCGDFESRQMLEHAIETGRGGVYLRLTPEQYARLRRLT
jgi:hypothetical protein